MLSYNLRNWPELFSFCFLFQPCNEDKAAATIVTAVRVFQQQKTIENNLAWVRASVPGVCTKIIMATMPDPLTKADKHLPGPEWHKTPTYSECEHNSVQVPFKSKHSFFVSLN